MKISSIKFSLENRVWGGDLHTGVLQEGSWEQSPRGSEGKQDWAVAEAELQSSCKRELSRFYENFWSWDGLSEVFLCQDKGAESLYPCINKSLDVGSSWTKSINFQVRALSCPGQCSEKDSAVSHLQLSEAEGVSLGPEGKQDSAL